MSEGVLFRADAGTAIGTGHVMRCLALAQARKTRAGRVGFAIRSDVPTVEERIRKETFEVERIRSDAGGPGDASETISAARASGASWVVVDGPCFGSTYQKALRESGLRVLAIDDSGSLPWYHADMILNQNLHADAGMYRRVSSGAELLLGPRYVLLRREFLERKVVRRGSELEGCRVLVTLGGADAPNHTLKVLRSIGRVDLPGLSAVVVIGGGNPHGPALEREARRSSTSVRLARNVENMPELMATADLAICAGGTTVWEMAFMGVPTLVGITTPLEERLVEGLRREGLFPDLGWFEETSEEDLAGAIRRLATDREARARIGAQGPGLIDGGGCGRVLDGMERIGGELHG